MSYKRNAPIPVVEGGTGLVTSTTAYAPICGGTTATGAFQAASTGLSTSGWVLTSNGAGALPSFQAVSAGSISITGNTGGALTGTSFTFTGGTTGLSFGGSGSTQTLTFAGITANGGTVSLATDATTSTINVGTGSGVKTSTFGSTNTSSTTTIQGGTGGIQLGSTFVNMPTTTSTVGQIRINNNRFLHAYGTDNTFGGSSAGNFTLTSTASTAFGANALQSLTSAANCTAVGANAGKALTGANNTAIGQAALLIATSGVENTAVGSGAMYNGIPGNANTAVGYVSLQNCTGGANAALGWGTLDSIGAGNYNVAVGYNAGGDNTGTDSNNVYLNSLGAAGDNNTLKIGTNTGTGTQQLNKAFIAGIRGITTGTADAIAVLIDSNNQLGTVSSSIRYKENVSDMGNVSSPVMNLRPVTFDFIDKPSHKKQVGLIAEEVEQIMPSLVAYNSEGTPESVKYHDLPVLLLNELQKLNKRIEELEAKLK
jgi:hypothetical protein